MAASEELLAFMDLCESQHLADCTLVAEGQRIPAHKAILFARSAYFRRMFAAGSRLQEAQSGGNAEIRLEGVKAAPFSHILHFWYTGCLQSSLELMGAVEVLQLADYFQAEDALAAVAKVFEAALTFRVALRLLIVARQHVHFDTAGTCHGSDTWADLWNRAISFIEEAFSGLCWASAENLAALEELTDPVALHIVLRSLPSELPQDSAQDIVSALENNGSLPDLLRPFAEVDCDQCQTDLDVSFSKIQWESTTPWVRPTSLFLLGCLQVVCHVGGNGADLWVTQSTSFQELSSYAECGCPLLQYGIRIEGAATLTCGSTVAHMTLNPWAWKPGWQMQGDTAVVSMTWTATPPPLAIAVVKGCISRLCDVNKAPTIPKWLPVGMMRSVLRRSDIIPPARLLAAMAEWASEQPDPLASCHQFHRVLSDVTAHVNTWDLMQGVLLDPNFRRTIQMFGSCCNNTLNVDAKSVSTNTEPVQRSSRSLSPQMTYPSTSTSCGTETVQTGSADLEDASDRSDNYRIPGKKFLQRCLTQ